MRHLRSIMENYLANLADRRHHVSTNSIPYLWVGVQFKQAHQDASTTGTIRR
jgi:hypothetical protein